MAPAATAAVASCDARLVEEGRPASDSFMR